MHESFILVVKSLFDFGFAFNDLTFWEKKTLAFKCLCCCMFLHMKNVLNLWLSDCFPFILNEINFISKKCSNEDRWFWQFFFKCYTKINIKSTVYSAKSGIQVVSKRNFVDSVSLMSLFFELILFNLEFILCE